ncbi:unnamed protein product [Schistosoma turkestanicum]|nr:unnamed protein product [Schistosoma turkestanicum]
MDYFLEIILPVISSHKPVIPTPNMDLFQVNDFDTSRSCYTSTTTRSISQKQSINKRPYSVGSTNSKLSNQIDSENDTNKTAAYSSYSSRKPFQCLPEKTNTGTKKNRPSSAPCILEENDKAAPAISELDNTTINASFTSRQSPTSQSDQKLSDQTVNREEEKSDQNTMNSPVLFDKKLLKECRIILEDQYDQALRRYGWRMEVHNDPLNLKSKLLPKRLSYSVKLNLQPVLPQPPKMKKQNIETFFQPTIKIPLPSFTISPDFTSECYNAHRNYLTKKGLWNYATRSYSFAY